MDGNPSKPEVTDRCGADRKTSDHTNQKVRMQKNENNFQSAECQQIYTNISDCFKR